MNAPGSGLLLRRSLFLGLLLWRSQAWACSCGGCLLGSHPTESLVQACSLRGYSLVPASPEVTGSGLLPQRLLGQACSYRGCCLGLAPVEATGLGLLLRVSMMEFS